MIFEPNQKELEVINEIHKYNTEDYVVIRLTKTMLNKEIMDANALLRFFLEKYDFVYYDNLSSGGKNGQLVNTEFISNDLHTEKIMNFYLANSRGDRRFSIRGIAELVRQGYINIDDLLYFSVNLRGDVPILTVINVSQFLPHERILTTLFGRDLINESLNRLIPKIRNIAGKGFHPNSKGEGKIDPKDAGDTLEYLLGIRTNNLKTADWEGIIELKSKKSKSMDTLFTLRPRFEHTPVEDYEPIDRNRVSALTRMYGYHSEKHSGYQSLYVTIGSQQNPQNNHNLFLNIDDERRIIELCRNDGRKIEVVGYWYFKDLENKLLEKHKSTLWVDVLSQMNGDLGEFKYVGAEFSRTPQFATFLSLINSGIITYDWRGYTTPEGKYSGKNHGNAWRIKTAQRSLLFGSMESINLKL